MRHEAVGDDNDALRSLINWSSNSIQTEHVCICLRGKALGLFSWTSKFGSLSMPFPMLKTTALIKI